MKTSAKNRTDRTGKNQRNKRGKQDRPNQQARPGNRMRDAAFKLRSPDNVLLYGRNSVNAALQNSRRQPVRLMVTEKGKDAIPAKHSFPDLRIDPLPNVESLLPLLPEGAPHQGIFLETRPLDGGIIEDLLPVDGKKNIILMLDQVTDPQNVGACLRSAAAFGARAVITQDRNSPAETGTLARASAGGLEATPWIRTANLAQALETLKDMGYWHVGLDGGTDMLLGNVSLGDNLVLVMGSEGKGLRPLVRKHCDIIAKIPMTGAVESLNVSNAAAIALYQMLQM